MDKRVAEQVMGLDVSPIHTYETRVTEGQRKAWDGEPDLSIEGWEEYREWERFEYTEERYWRKPVVRDYEPLPYSTSISAAWQVVEHTRMFGRWSTGFWDAPLSIHQYNDGTWEISGSRYCGMGGDPDTFDVARGEIAAEVICKAALWIVRQPTYFRK